MNANSAAPARGRVIKFNPWLRIGLLVAFLVLAVVMYQLDAHGVKMGQISENFSVSYLLFLIYCTVAAYELAALGIFSSIKLKGGAMGEAKMLTSFARMVMIFALAVVLLSSTGKLKELGALVGAFAGLLLGWSLQAPVSGIAAWVFINLKRPFRVGDRIQFPSLGLNGDVLEMGLMYTKLDQVGGAVGSEEAIGRYILIPNAMLFSQVVVNYTPQPQSAYTLDEVIVRLTYDSDWNAAEEILLNAAREVTAHIIRETRKEPYIRSDIYDYGVYMRLRYMTEATDRPRIAHEINTRIFREFQRNPRVDFAIPFIYSYRKGIESASRTSVMPDPIVEVPVDEIDDPHKEKMSPENQKGVEDLAVRIEKMGLLQPIIVRHTVTGRYELVAGRNRLLACKRLGWKLIPAIVRHSGAVAFDEVPKREKSSA